MTAFGEVAKPFLSVQNQGFNIIISVVGRFLLGILLLVGGFLYDIFSSVIFAIPTLLAKFTLLPLLSSWITNTHVGNDTLGGMLSNILGVNSSAAQGILSLSMSALGISILLAIFQYLKGGSKHANRRGRNKLTEQKIYSFGGEISVNHGKITVPAEFAGFYRAV